MAGYRHQLYADSLAEFGTPVALPQCGGWMLQRGTPGGGFQDATGCYPLFCCRDWQTLGDDLHQIGTGLVCLSLVADPFGNHSEELLRSLFDIVRPFKQHYVADLHRPLEEFSSARHRKYGRRVLRCVGVEVCSDPAAWLDEWVGLYGCLAERHAIRGLRRFSREALARQLAVPGLIMFRAFEGQETLGLDLWYVSGDVAYGHLVGISPRGYELQVSYGLKLFLLQYFAGRVRWVDLGGVSGISGSEGSGLAQFKQGWASETRTVFFCGKVFDRAAYAELTRLANRNGEGYFPAYRAGEFS